MSQRSTRRDPRVVAEMMPAAEAEEIRDAVERLIDRVRNRTMEPCRILSPGYDELVRTGRLAG